MVIKIAILSILSNHLVSGDPFVMYFTRHSATVNVLMLTSLYRAIAIPNGLEPTPLRGQIRLPQNSICTDLQFSRSLSSQFVLASLATHIVPSDTFLSSPYCFCFNNFFFFLFIEAGWRSTLPQTQTVKAVLMRRRFHGTLQTRKVFLMTELEREQALSTSDAVLDGRVLKFL